MRLHGNLLAVSLLAVAVLGAACSKADMPGEAADKATVAKAPVAAKPTAPAAAPAAPAAGETWQAGAALPDATKVTVAAVLATAETLKDKPVRVEGTVAAVCQSRGCWVELSDGDDKLIIKSLAHDIAFPKDGKGKRMVIEGIVRIDAPGGACDHKAGGEAGEGHAGHDGHHAGEAGEAAHECPKPKTLVEVRRAELLPQG